MSDKTPLASESSHWYEKDGTPRYEIPRADGKGMRPTTLADARKLDLVPSVTLILRCAAQPGLEAWKATQLLQSALTLPQRAGETLDDYALRVVEDSKEQARKARESGTELHAAIEEFIRMQRTLTWGEHIFNLKAALDQYGIDIFKGKPEHSFASPLGYGGKIDWHNDEIVLDFKTKKDLSAKRLGYDENYWQLAAYAIGLPGPMKARRILNVFVGIEDCEVRIHEWKPEDADRGFDCFYHLLQFWQIKNKWNGQK